jgi:hypothetical protein
MDYNETEIKGSEFIFLDLEHKWNFDHEQSNPYGKMEMK